MRGWRVCWRLIWCESTNSLRLFCILLLSAKVEVMIPVFFLFFVFLSHLT